ncbi:hypothetical protein [Segniliparus rugosus]|uniref:Uncharacterized protein n=1 Tax=Segniliparus rugosus (strain ATCC BAA-974 / DSM 45345 / CCUG 50838 / CIP 108380 / JCM 13579 / CDC 945) TaxID=679197 RepID=E5XTC1_SEGRC|nr:hypothetical protein [Segniliparus rugosus]EFV12383.1 hypothetical protein HMPREF9336_02743 [Segniliparus rugosus ATCC BAA-974]
MKLDTEKARQSGREVLAAKDELSGDGTPDSLRAAAEGVKGLALQDALAACAEGYEGFKTRFGNELDYIGHTVIAAAEIIDMTDEAAQASIARLDIPG